MTRLVSVFTLCARLIAADSSGAEEPYRIPAFWTESANDVAPRTSNFSFAAMHFSDPGNGWIVGHPFALEVRNHQVSTTVFRESDFSAVALASPGHAWIGGARPQRDGRQVIDSGVLWRQSDNTWREESIAGMDEREWRVTRLALAGTHDGWGLAAVGPGDEKATVILRYDDAGWSANPDLTPERLQWQGIDLCLTKAGRGWIVGKQPAVLQEDGRRQPVALALEAGRWTRDDPPALPFKRVTLNRVSCEPDGAAIAIGQTQNSDTHLRDIHLFLLRYTDRWRQLTFPEHLRSYSPNAVSVVGKDDFWLACERPDLTTTFVHVKDEQWTEVPAPTVPRGHGQKYAITAMAFPSPDEGWAAAYDYLGNGIVRGLVLHYKDGVWRNRNWDWHFWDERGWGLIGP